MNRRKLSLFMAVLLCVQALAGGAVPPAGAAEIGAAEGAVQAAETKASVTEDGSAYENGEILAVLADGEPEV